MSSLSDVLAYTVSKFTRPYAGCPAAVTALINENAMNDIHPSTAFAAFDELLDRVGSAVGPSEGHGLLCGLYSATSEEVYPMWRYQLVGDGRLDEDDAERLHRLVQETARQLEDAGFGFGMMLPDDEESLAERALALSEWCHGYLVGLGLGQPNEIEDEAVKEVLADLSQISKVSTQPEDCTTEEDENSYAELVEYVRVAVLMVNEHLRLPVAPSPESPPFLH